MFLPGKKKKKLFMEINYCLSVTISLGSETNW